MLLPRAALGIRREIRNSVLFYFPIRYCSEIQSMAVNFSFILSTIPLFQNKTRHVLVLQQGPILTGYIWVSGYCNALANFNLMISISSFWNDIKLSGESLLCSQDRYKAALLSWEGFELPKKINVYFVKKQLSFLNTGE